MIVKGRGFVEPIVSTQYDVAIKMLRIRLDDGKIPATWVEIGISDEELQLMLKARTHGHGDFEPNIGFVELKSDESPQETKTGGDCPDSPPTNVSQPSMSEIVERAN